MANNEHGFKNEREFIDCINICSSTEELPENLFEFFKFMSPQLKKNSVIKAQKVGGTLKPDLKISIDEKEFLISLKIGSANSVHQEKIESFSFFLENNSISKEDIENFKYFIWGDGTLDGTGEITARKKAIDLLKKPEILNSIKKIFDIDKKELLERFLFTGIDSSSPQVDFIYYGDNELGLWASKDEILSYLLKIPNDKNKLSNLTIQAWNRGLTGSEAAEPKRGVLQIKWGSLQNDLKKIREAN